MTADAPHRAVRPVAVGAASFVVALAGVVTLSDAAPAMLRRSVVLGSALVRTVGAPFGIDRSHRSLLPFDDAEQLAHFVGWGAVFVAVAALLPSLRLRFLAVGLVLVSAALEPAQSLLSQSRSYDPADVVTNAVGIVVGVALMSLWRIRRPSVLAPATRR